MSAFTHGFNHGFLHGMFNGMFGGFGAFNWCGWNSAPMFYTPSYNFGNFFQYPESTPSIPSFWGFTSAYTPQKINWSNENYNFSTNCAAPNFTASFNWGDTFIKSTNFERKEIESQKKTEKISYNAQELKTKWASKASHLNDDFYEKVIDISKKIVCNPNDLMALMHSETNGAMRPNKWHEGGSRAVGLIQFTDIAAKDLNTSLEQLEKMNPIEQLDYVEKFLIKSKNRKFSSSKQLDAGTLYALVYLPALADKDVLARRNNDPNDYYKKNKILDYNNDGEITKNDLANQLKRHHA